MLSPVLQFLKVNGTDWPMQKGFRASSQSLVWIVVPMQEASSRLRSLSMPGT
jgi:hypothetical protein